MKQLQRWFRPARKFVAVTVMLLAVDARAQSDLENVLRQFDAATVQGYMKPMADLFGANMNAGIYNSASIPDMFSFSFELIGMGSVVGDDQKMYDAALPAGYPSATAKMPTVFGPKATPVSGPSGLQFSGSDGLLDATLFPTPMLQVRGGILSTEAILRFVPFPAIGDDALPKVTMFGFGLRHSINRYLPALPLDVAGGFFYSKVSAGDVIDFTGLSIGAQASKSFALVRLYGGLAWENSTMNLNFTPSATGSSNVDIDLDGDNSFRFTVGAGLSLGVFGIFADANFGSITNFSGGIGVGF